MRLVPVLPLALVLAWSVPCRAQEPPPSAPQARRGYGDLQALGLSEDQKEKLRAIRQQHPDDPKARRKAAEEVLTPEQMEKLKELRRQRRQARRAPPPPPPQP